MATPSAYRNATPLSTLSVAVACGPVPCDTEEGRSFLQQRLAFYGKVCFVLSALLYIFFNLSMTLAGAITWSVWWTNTGNQLHLVACLIFLGIFLACRARAFPHSTLLALDTGGTVLVGVIVGLVYATEAPGAHPEAWGLLAITNTLLARAVIVPSSAPHTALTNLLASAPVLAGFYVGFDAPPEGLADAASSVGLSTTFLGAWVAFAAATATVASRVIYGLQQEVREAKELGQYTLENRIGAGGIGEVYKAKHLLLRRPTAVKLLQAEQTGEASLARFEREVQLTSQLTHPNTIAIYDYGRTPEGTFYYAMEYLDGINLEELVLRDGPQPAARVIHILRQVCGSLEEAHGTGLIHRDIKPANVILCERGGHPDVVKVVDFGLVKSIEASQDASVTGATTVTGTPLFLSPEAIRSPESVDARSDLYALGALAYRLVTGHHLFDSENFIEVCSLQLNERPTPPSARLGQAVPEDLERLIMKCLEKKPDERVQSASELRQGLEECADAGRWTEDAARRWWKEVLPRLGNDEPPVASSAATRTL